MTRISRDIEPYEKRDVDDQLYVEIGARIKKMRELKKYSRDRVAEELQVSVKHLYEIEFGKKRCTIHILAHLSLILSVSCDYLIFGSQETYINEKLDRIMAKLDEKQVQKVHEVLNLLDDIWTIVAE